MPDVFVSYNREDLPVAQRIVDGLVHEGLTVWLDMELKAGENYDEITEERLRDAKAVVVLWSSRSVKSRWVRAEATIGQRKSTLVPAMIEECDRPVMFELIQTTDLSKWEGDRTDPNWQKFVDVIRKRIAAAPPGPLFAQGGAGKPSAKDRRKAPPKQVAIRKEHEAKKPQRKGSFVTVLASAIVVGALIVGGLYALRPHEFGAFLASLTQATPGVTSDVAGLRTAGAETSTPALTATASPEVVAAAAPVEVEAVPSPVATVEETALPKPADSFRECDACPLMLNVQGGTFMMGAPDEELGRKAWEGPQRKVAMAPFAIGVSEVTFEEWDACVADGGCKYKPDDKGLGRGKLPVTQVSWKDAATYAAWLTKKTGRVHRLPTEAEWEYAGRGGSKTPFWWGAMYDATKAAAGEATLPVDALAANPLGLVGVSGNVREWTQDCYVNTFANAPLDGRSVEVAKCAQRVVRGGAFSDPVEGLRIAARGRNAPDFRDRLTGFRIAAAP